MKSSSLDYFMVSENSVTCFRRGYGAKNPGWIIGPLAHGLHWNKNVPPPHSLFRDTISVCKCLPATI